MIRYDWLGLNGGFTGSSVHAVHTFGSNQWLFNYHDNFAGCCFVLDATGDQFGTLTVVPEPGGMRLGAMSLLALLCHWRKEMGGRGRMIFRSVHRSLEVAAHRHFRRE